MTASPANGGSFALVTFDGDWPDDEREQVTEIVTAIEWSTTLPPAPEGWTPWVVKRIVVEDMTVYVAHRWFLEPVLHARSLTELMQKMEDFAG